MIHPISCKNKIQHISCKVIKQLIDCNKDNILMMEDDLAEMILGNYEQQKKSST